MYEEIIKDIQSQLTGEKTDQEYIKTQIDKYQNHEYSEEIIAELREILNTIHKEDNPKYLTEEEILEEVLPLIQKGQKEQAYQKLDKYMKNHKNIFQDDEKHEYHLFENELEEKLFYEYISKDKTLRLIPAYTLLTDLYYTYGYLLLNQGKIDEAEKTLKQALKINPVSCKVIFELMEICKITKDYERYSNYLQQAFTFAYVPFNVARTYRNMAYQMIEEDKCEIATALYKKSLEYDDTVTLDAEKYNITQKGYDTNITQEEMTNILKENNIQLGVNTFIIEKLKELGEEYANMKFYEDAIQMYNFLYDLEGDSKYKYIIKALEKSRYNV